MASAPDIQGPALWPLPWQRTSQVEASWITFQEWPFWVPDGKGRRMSRALYGNSSTRSRLLENLKPWGFPRREDPEKFLQEKKPKGLSKDQEPGWRLSLQQRSAAWETVSQISCTVSERVLLTWVGRINDYEWEPSAGVSGVPGPHGGLCPVLLLLGSCRGKFSTEMEQKPGKRRAWGPGSLPTSLPGAGGGDLHSRPGPVSLTLPRWRPGDGSQPPWRVRTSRGDVVNLGELDDNSDSHDENS